MKLHGLWKVTPNFGMVFQHHCRRSSTLLNESQHINAAEAEDTAKRPRHGGVKMKMKRICGTGWKSAPGEPHT